MYRAAVPPQWRTNRTHTGASGTLLLPKLLARSRNQLLVLGSVRSRPLPGAIMLYRFPQQILVDRAKDLVGEFQRANFFTAQIVNVDRCHFVFSCGAGISPAILVLA